MSGRFSPLHLGSGLIFYTLLFSFLQYNTLDRDVDSRELTTRWGILFNDTESEDAILIRTLAFIKGAISNQDKKIKKTVVKDIRNFLKRLSAEDTTQKCHIWRALLKIKDETIFIEFVNILLPCMWC